MNASEENLFKDPWQTEGLKFTALGCYVVTLIECLVLSAYVYYEIKGFAGPNRTILNRLIFLESLWIVCSIFSLLAPQSTIV